MVRIRANSVVTYIMEKTLALIIQTSVHTEALVFDYPSAL